MSYLTYFQNGSSFSDFKHHCCRIAEMEETHQDVVLKLREDMKREEEKHISRAVAEVRSEEEEKQQEMIQELKQKERERIQAAVDAERRIMESQHGSVTQLQQVR